MQKKLMHTTIFTTANHIHMKSSDISLMIIFYHKLHTWVCEFSFVGCFQVVTGQYESINEIETAVEELDDAIIVIETTTQSSACVLGHVTNMALILIGCITLFL